MENENSRRRKGSGGNLFKNALVGTGLSIQVGNKDELLRRLRVHKNLDSSAESHPSTVRDLPNNVTTIEKESGENLETSSREKQIQNSVPNQKHKSHFNESNSSRNHGDSTDRTVFRHLKFRPTSGCLPDVYCEKNETISDRHKSQCRQNRNSSESFSSRKDNAFASSYRSEHHDRRDCSKDYLHHNVNSKKKFSTHNSNSYDKRPLKSNPDFTFQHDKYDKKSSSRFKNSEVNHQLLRDSSTRHSFKNFPRQITNHTAVSELKEDQDLICVQKTESQVTNTEECIANLQTDILQDSESDNTNASDCNNPGNFFKSSEVSFVSDNSFISSEFKDRNNSAYSINEASQVSSLSDSGVNSQTCTDFSVLSESLSFTNLSDPQLLLSVEEESFIPPPTVSENLTAADSSSTSSERNESTNLQNESVDDVFSTELDSEHLEAISDFITRTIKEQSVKNSIQLTTKVVRDLNILFRNHFEGNPIDCYGSYDTDLAIGSSDINLLMKPDKSVRNSFMYEVYKILSKELEKYHVHPFEEGETAHKSKINFIHPETGVNCQLAYLGRYREGILEMGKFLKRVCLRDNRVKSLIIAVKVWAQHLNINEVEDGKLHPIGYALLVIHFLQHIKSPILPVYDDDCERQILPENNTSVGELWMSFLRYYSVTFNWKKYIVTVTSKEPVPKKSKNWDNFWIAIEDPFTGKNIAESVMSSDVADYIKACFKSSYEYFASAQVSAPSDEEKEGSVEESCRHRFEFSFQKCLVEQDDTFCEMCEEIDDVCDECRKKMYVKPMASLPKMTDNFLKKVEKVLFSVYNKYILTDDEIKERKYFVEKLQKDVQKIYCEAQLKLFGSSTNGFGFKNSDLDICMMLTDKSITQVAVLKDLRMLLRRNKDFDHVIVIFNAKIPIIKFHYQPKGWRGDISLANTLAVHNSELLYTYSLIDERCKILGCAFKLLAKKALISEVTDKALSSYSYLIMVIHFLQQTDPPVLPILQDNEYRRDDFKLEDIVENCNVWFCKDTSYVKEVFQTKNVTQVEELFLKLLDYYCSFDYNKLITIRQKELQLVGKKQRLARLFNIQDPFIETKNLGCVVSPKKAQETKSVLTRSRHLFRTPVNELPSGVKDLEDYFFSTMSLTGKIHKEALCDLCGKFGHEQKECQHNSFFQFRKPFYRKPFFKSNGHKHVSYNKYRQVSYNKINT